MTKQYSYKSIAVQTGHQLSDETVGNKPVMTIESNDTIVDINDDGSSSSSSSTGDDASHTNSI